MYFKFLTHDIDVNCVSVKGKEVHVVDYCTVSHDCLDLFPDFYVLHVTDMINSIPNLNCNASSSLPDHSLLKWNIVWNTINTDKEVDHGKSQVWF